MAAWATKISTDSALRAFNAQGLQWPVPCDRIRRQLSTAADGQRCNHFISLPERLLFMFDPVYPIRVIPAWALLVGSGLASAAAAVAAGASSPAASDPPLTAAPVADFQVAAVAGDPVAPVPDGHVQHAYAQVLVVEPAFEQVVVSRLVDYCRDRVPGAGKGVASLSGLAGSAPGPGAEGDAELHPASFDLSLAATDSCEQRREESVETQQVGYDVQYRYRGELFQSRLTEDPGDRLRIRVEITPAPAG